MNHEAEEELAEMLVELPELLRRRNNYIRWKRKETWKGKEIASGGGGEDKTVETMTTMVANNKTIDNNAGDGGKMGEAAMVTKIEIIINSDGGDVTNRNYWGGKKWNDRKWSI